MRFQSLEAGRSLRAAKRDESALLVPSRQQTSRHASDGSSRARALAEIGGLSGSRLRSLP